MTSSQHEKADRLRALHTDSNLLVLPNIWNPFGARVLETRGYPAIATASAAVSASLGQHDGQRLSRETMLRAVTGIARAVDVPVSADMESGYAETLNELAETTIGLIESGAVGLNIEDSLTEGGPLRPGEDQGRRIARIRETAHRAGVPLVINARIDTFLSGRFTVASERIDETVSRASIYVAAGADCVYPIGANDETTLKTLRQRINCPINVLASPSAPPLDALAGLGINRVSFGPYVYRACYHRLVEIADALHDPAAAGPFGTILDPMLSSAEAADFLGPR